ncbi:MAG: hypothetical protein KDD53_10995, partial [Bdellovibrionales bacterium]|nr:hypothetical protein [Bdellovibrionales bacterium]
MKLQKLGYTAKFLFDGLPPWGVEGLRIGGMGDNSDSQHHSLRSISPTDFLQEFSQPIATPFEWLIVFTHSVDKSLHQNVKVKANSQYHKKESAFLNSLLSRSGVRIEKITTPHNEREIAAVLQSTVAPKLIANPRLRGIIITA